MNEKLLVGNKALVKSAMQQMDDNGEKILFVVDNNRRLFGSLTDGDIRRWILSAGSLEKTIKNIYNKNPILVNEDYDIDGVRQIMLSSKLERVPVIDKNRKVIDVLFWENIFGQEVVIPKEKIDIPVVIMAGGRGNRLDPFTKVLPKALIPIKDKPIIEMIIGKFVQYGIKDFYISINHKSKMIKAYFEEINSGYHIQYIQEKEPLGTAGSLKLLENRISGSLLVTNCDTLIDVDYSQMYEFHQSKGFDMTIVGSYKRYIIPYGVCYIENGGILKELREKPEHNLLVNTGMYLLKGDILKLIPEGKFYLMTDLIKDVKENGGKVGVYPVRGELWIDVGQWEEYKDAVKKLEVE